jgi:hypothetical protein
MPRQKGSPVLQNLVNLINFSITKEIIVKALALVQLAYCALALLDLLITDARAKSAQMHTAP